MTEREKLNKLAKKNVLEKQKFDRVINDSLVCHDCKLKYMDGIFPSNTSKCERYVVKPDEVLSGGNCSEYIRE